MRRWSYQVTHLGFYVGAALALIGCGGGEEAKPEPVKQYSIQFTVNNLQGSLALQLNGQSDLTISKDGVYSFDKSLAVGSNYAVTVATQPGYQQCAVAAGTGTVSNGNVTNVVVNCTDLVSLTEQPTYYPASILQFMLPTANAEALTVTLNGMPITVQKGSGGLQYAVLPNNAVGTAELAYSVGTFSRKKPITVQALSLPSDPKLYVETQYQSLIDQYQQLRDSAEDPSLYDGWLAELKSNQSLLSTMSAEQLNRFALMLLSVTQEVPVAKVASLQAAAALSCEQFTTNYMYRFKMTALAVAASAGVMALSVTPVERLLAAGILFASYSKLLPMVHELYHSSCIRAITIGVEDDTGIVVVQKQMEQSYAQTTSAMLLKTGSVYQYTFKPTFGYKSVIETELKAVIARTKTVLALLPNALVRPALDLLDRFESPKLTEVTYAVTVDNIDGLNLGTSVVGNKLKIEPRVVDISKLTQSTYPTKLHVKFNNEDLAYDIDATVVVDFKPVVKDSTLQAELGKKTASKIIAENVTSFAVITQPSLGLLNFDGKTGAFDYTPNADTVGKTDTFTVRGTYLLGGDPNKAYSSEIATVTIEILPESFCEKMVEPGTQYSDYVYVKCYFDREKTKLKLESFHGKYRAYVRDPEGKYVNMDAYKTSLKIFESENSQIYESYLESSDAITAYGLAKLDRVVERMHLKTNIPSEILAGGLAGYSFNERTFESDSSGEIQVALSSWQQSDWLRLSEFNSQSLNQTISCFFKRSVLGDNNDPDELFTVVRGYQVTIPDSRTQHDVCPRSEKTDRELIKQKLQIALDLYNQYRN